MNLTDTDVEFISRAAYGPPTLEQLARSRYEAERALFERGGDQFLDDRYQMMRKDFEAAHGRITQEWWSTLVANGVVLTSRRLMRLGLLFRPIPAGTEFMLYRSTEGLSYKVHEAGPLLYRADNLALRSTEILRGSPQRVLVARLFGIESAYLQALESARDMPVGPEDDEKAREALREQFRAEVADAAEECVRGLDAAEVYYDTMAARSAQFDYFNGVLRGASAVALLILGAVLLADLLLDWSDITVPAETYASLIAAVIAGALGSCVSVMWRMSTGDFVSDYEAGRGHLRMIGMFRPFIGAMFGLALYFAMQANLVSFGNDDPDFYLLTFIAFVSGFSERFAPDVLGGIEGRGKPESSKEDNQSNSRDRDKDGIACEKK